jgi:hypothetical protein
MPKVEARMFGLDMTVALSRKPKGALYSRCIQQWRFQLKETGFLVRGEKPIKQGSNEEEIVRRELGRQAIMSAATRCMLAYMLLPDQQDGK